MERTYTLRCGRKTTVYHGFSKVAGGFARLIAVVLFEGGPEVWAVDNAWDAIASLKAFYKEQHLVVVKVQVYSQQ